MESGLFVSWGSKRKPDLGWVVNENGCHIWNGARSEQGYAQVRDDGRVRHVYTVRYEREIGPVPEGFELDHYVCNNGPRGCCNPHHCRPVTRRENQLRSNSVSARNLAKVHCPEGHELSGANLDTWQAKTGDRKCRICKAAAMRAYTARNRAAINARKRARYRAAKNAA